MMETERTRDRRPGKGSGICDAESADAEALRARVDTLGEVDEICTCSKTEQVRSHALSCRDVRFAGFFSAKRVGPWLPDRVLATFLCVGNLERSKSVGHSKIRKPRWLMAETARCAGEGRV